MSDNKQNLVVLAVLGLLAVSSFNSCLQLKEPEPKTEHQISDLIITNSLGQTYQAFIYGDDLEISPLYNIGKQ